MLLSALGAVACATAAGDTDGADEASDAGSGGSTASGGSYAAGGAASGGAASGGTGTGGAASGGAASGGAASGGAASGGAGTGGSGTGGAATGGSGTGGAGTGGTGTGGSGTGGSSGEVQEFTCSQDAYSPAASKPAQCANLMAITDLGNFDTSPVGYWGLYRNAGDSAGTSTPTFAEQPVVSTPGADSSASCLRYVSTANFTSGVRLVRTFGAGDCGDATTATGLSFWAKGDFPAETGGWGKPADTLIVIINGAGVGDSDFHVPVTTSWKQYKIPFKCLSAGAPTFKGYATEVQFHARGASFDFAIDDVEFY